MYDKFGIRKPRGILLYGPPGTGKTLMAKALANECNIPFIYACGSDFVEIFIGVGAKRVRELFSKARKHKNCIIFIDEIDSLGGHRGRTNQSKEFDSTLNQLLSEMDGFKDSEGITVIGATNQECSIDEALMRAGRFDQKIKIDLPNCDARKQIIKIHLESKGPITDLSVMPTFAKLSEGFSGADIEGAINEASTFALKRCNDSNSIDKSEYITSNDIENGFQKIILQMSSLKQSRDEKENKELLESSKVFRNMFPNFNS